MYSRGQSVIHRPTCTHSKGFSLSSERSTTSGKLSTARRASSTRKPSARVQVSPTSRDEGSNTTFPGPLVLPGDVLDACVHDFEADDAQSFEDWTCDEERNPVTLRRRKIYIGAPPTIGKAVSFLDTWKVPRIQPSGEDEKKPKVEDVMDYIAAFYSPLPVRRLKQLEFTEWDGDVAQSEVLSHKRKRPRPSKRRKAGSSRYVALQDQAAGISTRISTRRAPPGHPYWYQLSANDIIDALIESVPEDAYAVLLLLHHDLYEDADDAFIIGRAYGGSRVAVMSMARYGPILYALQDIEMQHRWPMSHCVEYIQRMGGKVNESEIVDVKSDRHSTSSQPMLAAISNALVGYKDTAYLPSEYKKTWLHRVCLTASHELGHCFGLDHCMYYSCMMQSSANAAEDMRQPGYLCPVDLAKLLEATGSKGKELEWCRGLVEVCDSLGPGGGFGALQAWMKARMTALAEAKREAEAIEDVGVD